MSKEEKLVKSLLKLADINVNGHRPFDIQVLDERFYKRVISSGTVGLGEAYIDGWWRVEQLDEFVARVVAADIRSKLKITPEAIKTIALAKIINRQNLIRSSKNARHHYDIGNDLYEAMLDKRMIYSCAYWKNAKTLDEAQENKLELICKKLQLKPGMTLLDIGCGWGGYAEYAAVNYGVSVTGITPAAEQVKLARDRTKNLSVQIKQLDYRKISGKFDRIVSIGMLEHVGPKNYKEFFQHCERMLSDNGIMLHHTIGGNRSVNTTDPWIDKYIFPGGVLPSLTQISGAVEDLLVIEDVQNFGPYYDKTLMAWYKNFSNNYKNLPQDIYDDKFFRMWTFYLLSCAGLFRARQTQLWQIVMRKPTSSGEYISSR